MINIDAPDSDPNNLGVVKDQFYQHHGSVGSNTNQSSSGNVKSQGAVAAAIKPAPAHLSMSLVKTQIELGLQEQKNSGPFGTVDERKKLSFVGRPANSEFEAYQRQQEHSSAFQRPLEVKNTSSPDEEMSLAGADREAITVKNYDGA